MTTVLVTGARGNTGREVAASVAARPGVDVRGGSTSPATLQSDGVTPILFDWGARDTWAPALNGIDAVYLARPEVQDSPALVSAFVAAAEHVDTIVLLSEMGAEHMPPETWVQRVESAFLSRARPGTILRPTWFAQVLTDERFFLGSIRDERRFAMPSAGAAISFIDTRDIAAVAVEALLEPRHRGEAYTLSGPQALTLQEVADRISDAVSAQVTYQQTQITEAMAELNGLGGEPWLLGLLRDLYERVEAGGFGQVTDAVERVTGTAPRSLDMFVAEHVERWRA